MDSSKDISQKNIKWRLNSPFFYEKIPKNPTTLVVGVCQIKNNVYHHGVDLTH